MKLKIKETTGFFIDDKLPPEKIQQCLDTYEEAYNPVNRNRMEEEFKYLDSMLQRARKLNIDTTVAYMPLTAQNLALLPTPVADEIRSRLKKDCEQNGAHFIDLNNPEIFKTDDFTDGVHLNSRGAAKFCNVLTSELSSLNGSNYASRDSSQSGTVRSIAGDQRVGTN
jgi:lysophospholipase L1-like esterase